MQVYLFCYHKVGTILLSNIFKGIARTCGLTFATVAGPASEGNTSKDIVHFVHSIIDFDLSKRPHKGVRLIRDPRDIWLSGYLYHRHCAEPWCVNEDFAPRRPIRFPRVPYALHNRTEEWKESYLLGLNGRSYQDNLLALDNEEGMTFELDRYTDWTVSQMAAWRPDPDTIEIRMEDFMEDFDRVLTTILRHCGFGEADIPGLVAAAGSEDIRRMSEAQLQSNAHIHSRSISKWRQKLTLSQINCFEERYGAEMRKIGYG